MSDIELLRASQLFAGCSEPELVHLALAAKRREFGDGELVLPQGELAKELMLIESGDVRLMFQVSVLGESKAITFERKRRGDIIGWSALVPPHRLTLSGRADGRATVVTFSRSALSALFDAEPELGFRVMRNVARIVGERLHHSHEMWAAEVQRSLDERYR